MALIQRWASRSWEARWTASTSWDRNGRSSSRSVRTDSVIRSTELSERTPAPSPLARSRRASGRGHGVDVMQRWSPGAEDAVDRYLEDDACGVLAGLPV